MSTITIPIDPKTAEGYSLFLECKKLPRYRVVRNVIETDEGSYEYVFGKNITKAVTHINHPSEFDYQRFVVERALERQRYAAFLDCGLGKTQIELMFANDVINQFGGKALIWCPLAVIEEFQRESIRLWGSRISNLRHEEWKTPIAIINYEGMRDVDLRDVCCVVLDESSILKSGDGQTCEYLTNAAASIPFRLACSATPSPNDQTEYAAHAVWLGICSTAKEFYSRFFVKDGTHWRMKDHARDAFYDFLRSWACYIASPTSLGFQRGAELVNEPHYITLESYPKGNYFADGKFLAESIDLVTARKLFGQLRADTTEKRFVDSIAAIEKRHAIVWCSRNDEEKVFARALGVSPINGAMALEKRIELCDAFKRGELRHIVSKPSVLGFGVNLQEAEAHLYSGYTFSFEEFYQAVRRSHRYGRSGVLDVIVPVSEPERPVWDILQRKLATFKGDVAALQSRFVTNRRG